MLSTVRFGRPDLRLAPAAEAQISLTPDGSQAHLRAQPPRGDHAESLGRTDRTTPDRARQRPASMESTQCQYGIDPMLGSQLRTPDPPQEQKYYQAITWQRRALTAVRGRRRTGICQRPLGALADIRPMPALRASWLRLLAAACHRPVQVKPCYATLDTVSKRWIHPSLDGRLVRRERLETLQAA